MAKEQTKAQNLRAKPSFEVYASDWMASEEYALASPLERGLFFSLLNYCWVNGSIPADCEAMALLLRLDPQDVAKAMGRLIRKEFLPSSQDATRLYCPELERQKRIISERRLKQIEGRKKGGTTTQEGVRALKGSLRLPKAPEMKRNEMNRNAVFREEHYSEHKEWLEDYDGEAEFENGD